MKRVLLCDLSFTEGSATQVCLVMKNVGKSCHSHRNKTKYLCSNDISNCPWSNTNKCYL